ncbi:glycosyltransferase family 39 protein [Patescibacteria group bacterium]|nr:glycosyltransferase family 39 protein [Patescibacteria group bacterium]
MRKMREKIKQIKNIKNIEYIILSLIMLLGLFLRLYKIDNPVADWHSFRQADTASVSKLYVQNGVNLFYPKYHDISTTQSGLFNPEGHRFVELPIFNIIHVFLASISPQIPFDVLGRMVSVLTTLISSYAIFLLGKRFISTWGGVFSSAFHLLLPFNIYFTRVILPEPLSVLFGLLGLMYFVKFIDNEKFSNLLMSSVFFALGILVKPYIIFYGVPVIYLAIKKYGFRKALYNKKLIASFFLIFLPVFVWRSWMKQFPEGIPFWKWTFNGDDIRFRPSFWRWIFGERLTKLILGYWGLVPFAYGLINYKKGKHFMHAFLLGMFLYVSIIATANVRHDYYQTIVMPAISLVLSRGVLFLWNSKNGNLLARRLLLVFSLLICLITSVSEIREFYKINHPEIIEAGLAVQKIVPEDSLIIAPYNGDTAFLYQTNRRGWPVVDRPIDELIENGAEYFVSVDLGHYQTVEFSQRFEVLERTDNYVIIKFI